MSLLSKESITFQILLHNTLSGTHKSGTLTGLVTNQQALKSLFICRQDPNCTVPAFPKHACYAWNKELATYSDLAGDISSRCFILWQQSYSQSRKLLPSLAALGDTWVRRVAQLERDQSCSGKDAEPGAGHQLGSSRPAAPREAQTTADGQKSHL